MQTGILHRKLPTSKIYPEIKAILLLNIIPIMIRIMCYPIKFKKVHLRLTKKIAWLTLAPSELMGETESGGLNAV